MSDIGFRSQSWAEEMRMRGSEQANAYTSQLGNDIAAGFQAYTEAKRYREAMAMQAQQQKLAERNMLMREKEQREQELNGQVERNLRGLQAQEIEKKIRAFGMLDQAELSKQQVEQAKLTTQAMAAEIKAKEAQAARDQRYGTIPQWAEGISEMIDVVGLMPNPEKPNELMPATEEQRKRAAAGRRAGRGASVGREIDQRKRDYVNAVKFLGSFEFTNLPKEVQQTIRNSIEDTKQRLIAAGVDLEQDEPAATGKPKTEGDDIGDQLLYELMHVPKPERPKQREIPR